MNGAPPIGWGSAVAYLVLPILLVVSQYVSQKIISPQQSQDESQKSANAILKFLPLMIGKPTPRLGLYYYYMPNFRGGGDCNVLLRFSYFISGAAPCCAAGWFSLNVPSGLTLYWFVNNILSTAQQIYLKRTTKITIPEPALAASSSSSASVGSILKPKEERIKQVIGERWK